MRLAKQYYRLVDDSKKINCYHLTITKQILKEADIDGDAELVIKVKKKKIIIEEAK